MLLCLLEVLVFSNFSLLDAPDLMESTGPDQVGLRPHTRATPPPPPRGRAKGAQAAFLHGR